MTTGIHHVTLITRKVQANVDFYAGFLGLRLVKQTGGFEDAEQLHLFYGDAMGSPGSVVTFLVWEDGAPGRVGRGQISEIAFAVPPQSLGQWLTRAITAQVPVSGPTREFGEPVLRLKDPDGVIVKLVGVDMPAQAPLADADAPRRVRAVTLLTDKAEGTAAFLAYYGYRSGTSEGNIRRLFSDTDAIDVRDATGFYEGIPGTGIFDHVALRAPDFDAVEAMQRELMRWSPTNVHDRKYFRSLYARDSSGILTEYATDTPGFAVDEPPAHLGERLFVPEQDAERAQDLRVMLPQFARPGEERIVLRDLPFVHRFFVPEDPDGSTVLLLHGSGGHEADLMPFAHRLLPRATLMGVRGRSTEEGHARWFRRRSQLEFDQQDIRFEAEAFDEFWREARGVYGLDRDRTTVLGLSNGANFAAAVTALYPDTFRRAILIRPMLVLEAPEVVDLSDMDVLTLTGRDDPFAPHGAALDEWLLRCGAKLETRSVPAGHGLVPADLILARAWAVKGRDT
ncbi:phospholipase/carboxylesterase [Rhizobium aquaticum]|uniref:Phospholipase/carboxylesterase n=1 Tax=Rhizobium aquaticum TaxID=1549636 RepID=A0ABV2J488_9HYPH